AGNGRRRTEARGAPGGALPYTIVSSKPMGGEMDQSALTVSIRNGLLAMAAVAASAAFPANAQDSAPAASPPAENRNAQGVTDLDAVQVTGIRASIRKSQALKQ